MSTAKAYTFSSSSDGYHQQLPPLILWEGEEDMMHLASELPTAAEILGEAEPILQLGSFAYVPNLDFVPPEQQPGYQLDVWPTATLKAVAPDVVARNRVSSESHRHFSPSSLADASPSRVWEACMDDSWDFVVNSPRNETVESVSPHAPMGQFEKLNYKGSLTGSPEHTRKDFVESSLDDLKSPSIARQSRYRLFSESALSPEEDPQGPPYKQSPHYKDGQWNRRYKQLVEYKSKHGNCFVPHDWKPNKSLAQWVKRQRHQYKLRCEGSRSNMTDERLQALQDIGFIWQSNSSKWDMHFKELVKFMKQNRHSYVSDDDNPKLATWVKSQRRQFRELFLSEAIGTANANDYEGGVDIGKRVRAGDGEIGRDISGLIRRRKTLPKRMTILKSKLTKERILRLQSIGFSFYPPGK